jgi:FtsZ-interacting cell division protein YlmF
MVYLGLQDDDEEYGYDSYDYGGGEYADERRYGAPDVGAHPDAEGRGAHEYADVGARSYADPRDPKPVREPPAPVPRGDYGEPSVRAVPRDDAPSGVSVPRPPIVRSVPTTAARVHVVEPLNFNDAQEIGDRVKENQAVILNLQGASRELQRRIIDFSSGLAYAAGGSMSRIADSVFLLTPMNVQLSEEEKERLEARGLYRR